MIYLQQLNDVAIRDTGRFFKDYELYNWRSDMSLFELHFQIGLF
jgi:hypothetical protein